MIAEKRKLSFLLFSCALHSIDSYETLVIIHSYSMHEGSGNETHVTNVPLLSDLISAVQQQPARQLRARQDISAEALWTHHGAI